MTSVAIQRLPDSAPAYIPVGSDFSSVVGGTLGTAGTGQDGWDSIFSAPAGSIDGDSAALAVLDSYAIAADYTDGAFAAVMHTPVDKAIGDFWAAGDPLLAPVVTPGQPSQQPTITQQPITVDVPSTPPPVDIPTSGGGGGGGGGTGAPPPPPIDTGGGTGTGTGTPPGETPPPPGGTGISPVSPSIPAPTNPPAPLPPPVLPPIDPIPPPPEPEPPPLPPPVLPPIDPEPPPDDPGGGSDIPPPFFDDTPGGGGGGGDFGVFDAQQEDTA